MSTPTQWELGGEIMSQGSDHPSFKVIRCAWDQVTEKLKQVQEQSANLKKVGVGRTEDPTLILAEIVPALRDFAEVVAVVTSQLEERLK